ncbi:MAG: hypothetical protein ACLUUO_17925 [Sellimonas intestinalis]
MPWALKMWEQLRQKLGSVSSLTRIRRERQTQPESEQLSEIGGIGDVIAGSFTDHFQDRVTDVPAWREKLLKEVKLTKECRRGEAQIFTGMQFVTHRGPVSSF